MVSRLKTWNGEGPPKKSLSTPPQAGSSIACFCLAGSEGMDKDMEATMVSGLRNGKESDN